MRKHPGSDNTLEENVLVMSEVRGDWPECL